MISIKERDALVEYSFLFILGAVLGSFLNVVILRVPKEQSIIYPGSTTPCCNKKISWFHNIPLLSYIFLRAKCSYCNTKISKNYFLVEFLAALIMVLVFYKNGFYLNSFIIVSFFYLLLVLSFIDFAYKAVPSTILLLTFILVFFIKNDFYQSLENALLFAGAAVLLNFLITYYIQNIKAKFKKDESLKEQTALGEGDIPIIASVGILLGVEAGLFSILLAAIFAIIPAVYYLIKKDEIETPFIPFLSLGIFIEYIYEISKAFK